MEGQVFTANRFFCRAILRFSGHQRSGQRWSISAKEVGREFARAKLRLTAGAARILPCIFLQRLNRRKLAQVLYGYRQVLRPRRRNGQFALSNGMDEPQFFSVQRRAREQRAFNRFWFQPVICFQ